MEKDAKRYLGANWHDVWRVMSDSLSFKTDERQCFFKHFVMRYLIV